MHKSGLLNIMFLITTADQRFWKTNGKILFLGEWCKSYDQKHVWGNLDYTVADYHWNDRTKLYKDYVYLREVYERYLKSLTEQMNMLHCETHSLRYWRIILGPWLHYFIAILYDRYASLKSAFRTHNVSKTLIVETKIWEWAPQQMSHFKSLTFGDEYNLVIYSEIIKKLKMLPYESVIPNFSGGTLSCPLNRAKKKNGLIHNAKLLLKKYLTYQSTLRNPGYVFISSYLPVRHQLRLEFALKQLPTIFYEIDIPEAVCNPGERQKIIIENAKTEFESLLDYLIPYHMPISYVENYKSIQALSYRYYPSRPKVIFTACAFDSNEAFKLWAGRHTESGVKLIIGQHGGHYGSGLWDWSEEHEVRIANQYFSWGWGDPHNPKVKPSPSGKLLTIKKSHKANVQGPILWALCSLPRYSYWMYSIPVAGQFVNYIDDQIAFAGALNSEARKLLLLRYFMHDFGWGEREMIRDARLGIQEYTGRKSLNAQIARSRLFIGTYDSTTYLEALTANVPTILFWNKCHWEIRNSAVAFYQQLFEAGILHESPESAAEKVNEIYQHPWEWWTHPRVQKAKQNFCKRFANKTSDWLNIWKGRLQEMALNSEIGGYR